MENKIIAYKSVYERSDAKEFSFSDLILDQYIIFNAFKLDDYKEKLDRIKNIEDKEKRNQEKRNYIPAVDLSMSGILSIDIDGINKNEELKFKLIEKLSKLNSCHVLMESVSGNLVAFFKYDCSAKDFPFLYYKIYLELTLLLSVNIDFLPEIGRLRYLSIGEVYHIKNESEILTEIMECDRLPYINTSVGKDKVRKLVFGSK